jgi:hypothetical protein
VKGHPCARLALAAAALLVTACTQRDRDRGAPVQDAAASSATATSPSLGASDAPPAVTATVGGTTAFPTPRPRAEVAAPIPVSTWVWKTYQGDHFSASFPGEPRITVLPAEDDKVGYTEALLDMPGGQVSFAAGFSEHTKEEVAKPDAFLDEHADAPRRGLTDVLHKRAITLPGGHPGRVLILRRNISGTPLRIYSRLHLVGTRLYSLIVSTLDVGGISEDAVRRFMESFKPLGV